jgi:integrase
LGKLKANAEEYAGLGGRGRAKIFTSRCKSSETDNLTLIEIGRYSDVSLAEARAVINDFKALRKTGVCPKAQQVRNKAKAKREKEERLKEQEISAFTVADLIDTYLAEFIEDRLVEDARNPEQKKRISGARKPKGQAETRRTLYGDPVRVLGKIPAASITRKQVTELIMDIVARGANVQAGSVLRELSAAYEYSIGLGRFGDEFANPALLAKASLKQARVRLTSEKGRRVLSDKELAEVLKWLPRSGFSATQKNVLRLTLWTGCRTGEVCSAEWRDIDTGEGVWHVRDSKNGSERYVQLSTQAVEFLKNLQPAGEIYLFSSSRTALPIQQKSLAEKKWHLKTRIRFKTGRDIKRISYGWIVLMIGLLTICVEP